jgi:hypothetical protein
MSFVKYTIFFIYLSINWNSCSACPDKQVIYSLFKEFRNDKGVEQEISERYCSMDYDAYISLLTEDELSAPFIHHDDMYSRENFINESNHCVKDAKDVLLVFGYNTKCINEKSLDLIMEVESAVFKDARIVPLTIRYIWVDNKWKVVRPFRYGTRLKNEDPAIYPIDLFVN